MKKYLQKNDGNQLKYVDRLTQGKILPLDEISEEKVDIKNIRTLLSEYTWILPELTHQYDIRTGGEFDKNGRDLFKEKIVNSISIFLKKIPKIGLKKRNSL